MDKTCLYFMDLFKELSYSFQDILEAWDRDPLEPFKMVKDIVEREYGTVYGVRVYGSYFKSQNMTAVIEYMIEHSHEITGVKIIHAENPAKALQNTMKLKDLGEDYFKT